MSRELSLEVVTPGRMVIGKTVESVTAPGILGEFSVLPGHAPFLSALGIGSLRYRQGGRAYYLFISGGVAEVLAEKVIILAEVAELPEEIDLGRASRARERAARRLESERRERLDQARAHAALQRALMRLKCREEAKLAGTCAM